MAAFPLAGRDCTCACVRDRCTCAGVRAMRDASRAPVRRPGRVRAAVMMLLPLLLLLLCVLEAAPSTAAAATRTLPDGAVMAGYTNQGNASTIVRAVDHGVNVLIWSFIELQGNVTDDPVQEGPDPATVAEVVTTLHSKAVSVTHLVSVGGWGAPHPDTAQTGPEWWETWKRWDARFAERVGLSPDLWNGFAGVDLDVEGADAAASSDNHFPSKLIELCGTFALAAKRDGYISTMVPPQSYLDCGSPNYDRDGSVEHADEWAPHFPYHGQNTYAPLLSPKYADGYDLVIIQLYEGFSRAGHEIFDNNVHPTDYLAALARKCSSGWTVKLTGGDTHIRVPPEKLVIGLANGWATQIDNGTKFLYIDGDSAGLAYQQLGGTKGLRGFGYWDINQDDPKYSLVPKLVKHMQLEPSTPAPTHDYKFIIAIVVAAVVGVGSTVLVGVKCWRGNREDNRKTSLLEEPLNS